MNFFIGIVTTPNRQHYLHQLCTSIELYKQREHGYRIEIVNDTKGEGIHRMRNYLLRRSQQADYDFGFLMDDDIFVKQAGWESLYYVHAMMTGHHHLSYFNPNWIKACAKSHPITVYQSMGCLHTFTKQVVDAVGAYDVANFGTWGGGHWDWSARACRAGFNDANRFADAPNSNDYIGMQIENYTPATAQRPKEDFSKKAIIMRMPNRLHIPL